MTHVTAIVHDSSLKYAFKECDQVGNGSVIHLELDLSDKYLNIVFNQTNMSDNVFLKS